MESIRIWLNGDRLYSSGVKLYNQYGNDALLKRLFAEPIPSDFKTKKLLEALQGLLPIKLPVNEKPILKNYQKVIDSTPPAVKEHVKKTMDALDRKFSSGTTRWSEKMDETETVLYNQWKPVFLEMNELCAKVGDVAREGKIDPYKQVQACQMALRILDLEDECDDFYNQRDHYLEHGRLAESKPYGEPCHDVKLIPKKLANAERYVRDYRRKLETHPTDINAAEQLQKHQWFVDYYKRELKLI